MFLTRFRRVTRDGRWIPEIDGLRFVAIISVMLFHLLKELQSRSDHILPVESRYSGLFGVISNGNSGVSLFFVISGFVLALPFARHHLASAPAVSLRKYFMRRVTRLEPPYLISVLLFVSLLAFYSRHFTADLARHAVVTAVYLHSLVYGRKTLINSVSWSLEVEIQFYILAPLVMHFYRIRPKMVRRAVMAMIIVVISLAQYALVDSTRWTLSILFYLQFFLMGLLLADFYIAEGDGIRSSMLWDVTGVLGLAVTFGVQRAFVITHIAMPWAMALIFLGALRGVVLRRFFANPWVATIGGMCYSIYLLHFQMIAVFFKFTRNLVVARFDFLANYAIQIVVTAVPVLLISSVYFLLIERPCMDPNWPSRFWHRISGRSRSEADAFDSGVATE